MKTKLSKPIKKHNAWALITNASEYTFNNIKGSYYTMMLVDENGQTIKNKAKEIIFIKSPWTKHTEGHFDDGDMIRFSAIIYSSLVLTKDKQDALLDKDNQPIYNYNIKSGSFKVLETIPVEYDSDFDFE